VTFVEFMMYINEETSFEYSDQQYR